MHVYRCADPRGYMHARAYVWQLTPIAALPYPHRYENKTVAGTLAVATFAFLSLDIPEVSARLGVAVVCALAEAFGTLANRTVYARTTEHTHG